MREILPVERNADQVRNVSSKSAGNASLRFVRGRPMAAVLRLWPVRELTPIRQQNCHVPTSSLERQSAAIWPHEPRSYAQLQGRS